MTVPIVICQGRVCKGGVQIAESAKGLHGQPGRKGFFLLKRKAPVSFSGMNRPERNRHLHPVLNLTTQTRAVRHRSELVRPPPGSQRQRRLKSVIIETIMKPPNALRNRGAVLIGNGNVNGVIIVRIVNKTAQADAQPLIGRPLLGAETSPVGIE